MLSEPELYPAPALEGYRDMPDPFRHQFASVAFAFESIPLAMAGERHAAGRRFASAFLATRRDAIHAWVSEALPGYLAPLAAPGQVEMMGEVIKPLVRGLTSTITGVELPAYLRLDHVSLVFDKSISMTRRRGLEADMREVEAHIRTTLGPDAGDEDVGLRLGLLVVGKDAMVGTLGESLVRLFLDNAGRRLNQIEYPPMPHQTAVPFVERIAASPVTVAGLNLKRGDRVRVVLLGYTEHPDQHHRFFGAGPHACLGRPLSVETWSALCAVMAGLDSHVTVLDYHLADDEYVFNVARRFAVEVTR
jgi:hypothetical protein